MKKRLLFLTALILLVSFSKPASARDEPGTGYPWEPGYDIDRVFVEATDPGTGMNMVKWWGEGFIWGLQLLEVSVVGAPTEDGGRSGGLVPLASATLGSIYHTPPIVNTSQALASLGVIRTAHAAPSAFLYVLEVWKISRNVAYLIITLVLIAVGVMIMFRKKIDPRVTVTIANSLPKIVISLILITFSYAIASIIFDLAITVTTGVTNSLLSSIVEPEQFRFHQVWTEFGVGAWSDVVGKQITGDMGAWGIAASKLFSLAIGFALFSVMIKLLFKLVICYATMFFLTIGGPVIFATGGLPAKEGGLQGWWFKKFLSSALAFPAVHLVLNLALYLKELARTDRVGHLSEYEVPFFATEGNLEFLGSLLFFGIILTAASIPDAIDAIITGGKAPRIEAEDLSRSAQKIPIIGGLF